MHALALLLILLGQIDPKEERRYPPQFEAATEIQFFREMLQIPKIKADVRAVEGSEPVPVSPLTLHRVEITGQADTWAVAMFLDIAARRDYRAAELESFSIRPDGNFKARFLLPVVDLESRLPLTGEVAERFQSKKTSAVASLLGSIPDDRPIHVTEVKVDKKISLRGAVAGAAARAQIKSWLEEKGFGKSTMTIAEEGGCRPFAVEVVPGRAGERMSVLSRPEKIFNASDVALCKPKLAKNLGTLTVQGSGPIDLRLKRADISTLALVLHDVTGENFIVDSGVTGTVNVEAKGATAEQIFAAMPSIGLRLSGGPVRRISLASGKSMAAPEDTYSGEPVTLSLQNAGLAAVLCLFADMTKLNIVIPPTAEQSSAIFVRELPWDRALVEVIAAAGLNHTLEKTTLYVGDSKVGGAKTCEVAASRKSPPLSGYIPLEVLSAGDLDLIGRASVGGKLTAYASTPSRLIHKLDGGEKLFESTVAKINSDGVVFKEEERQPFEIFYDDVSVPAIIGNWECVSGPCVDPEIGFLVEEKVLEFRSWLHHRPSAVGSWKLSGKTVTVNCCSGAERTFEIVSVTAKELVLREDDEDEPARYRRIPD